jgi:hypothetical protein
MHVIPPRKGDSDLEFAALLYLLVFAASGVCVSGLVFRGDRPVLRLWLGLVAGLVMLMWFPALFAFISGSFDIWAQLAALVLALILGAVCLRLGGRPRLSLAGERRFLLSILPLVLIGWVLMLNHVIVPASDGSLHSGQSTYGDMCMHLGIISSISVQQSFPPEYSLLPGTAIGYPFLCDSVSSTFYTLGAGLRFSALLPATYAYLLVVAGAYLLFEAWLGRGGAATLALYLFFVGGGFGFAYFFDLSEAGGGGISQILSGFYTTPTNYTDKGIYWVNPIADMLVPQRATLFGWALLFPCLHLLYRAAILDEHRLFLPLGVLAGCLPLVHTHSFLALGVISLVLLIANCLSLRGGLRLFLCYGLIAAALAAPQLLCFTFKQAASGSFLRLHWNWVNDKDSWLWFYVKNMGLIFLLMPPALACARRESRLFFAGGALLWLICELVVFQPNLYDNNKLIFVSYALMCGLTAEFMAKVWTALREGALRRAAPVLAAFTLTACFLSGGLTLAREYVSGDHLGLGGWVESGYQVVSAQQRRLAEYVSENTEPDAVFATATNHNNAIAMLTDRSIVCGAGTFLYYHGLDYQPREAALKLVYEQPAEWLDFYAQEYGIDYLLVSSHERGSWAVDEENFAAELDCVYSDGDLALYSLK